MSFPTHRPQQLAKTAALCLLAANTGCATIIMLSSDRAEKQLYDYEAEALPVTRSVPRVYSGVATDALCLWHLAPVLPLCVVDLPLSLVADTLVLPFTAWQQIKFGNFHSRFIPDEKQLAVFRAWLERDRRSFLDHCRRALEAPPAHPDTFSEFCRRELATEDAVRESVAPDAGLPFDGGTAPR